MMDANHDGYVTPAEIDAISAQRFARMDANHDGVVTPDERRAMRGGTVVAWAGASRPSRCPHLNRKVLRKIPCFLLIPASAGTHTTGRRPYSA